MRAHSPASHVPGAREPSCEHRSERRENVLGRVHPRPGRVPSREGLVLEPRDEQGPFPWRRCGRHLPPILGLDAGLHFGAAAGSAVEELEQEVFGAGGGDLIRQEAVCVCPSELEPSVVKGESPRQPRVWRDEGDPRGVIDADGTVREGHQKRAERVGLWQPLAHRGGKDVGGLQVQTVCRGRGEGGGQPQPAVQTSGGRGEREEAEQRAAEHKFGVVPLSLSVPATAARAARGSGPAADDRVTDAPEPGGFVWRE
eukprot:scaffold5128_cov104-Isochrysis_galbana.AAC.4